MRVIFRADIIPYSLGLGIVLALSQFYTSYANGEHDVIQEYRIGIVCNYDCRTCVERSAATSKYLTREMPHHLFTIIPIGYDQFKSAVRSQIVDFVICCPSVFIRLERLCGVTAIATMKMPYTQGSFDGFAAVFLYNSDRKDIQYFEDLKDKTIQVPHGAGCSTWNIACWELSRHGLHADRDFRKVTFSLDPSEIIGAVREGDVDVGVVRSDLYDRLKAENKIGPDEFCVLHEDDELHKDVLFEHSTSVFPERVFAKLRHTSDYMAERVTIALLKLRNSDMSDGSVRHYGWTIPHDYEPYRDVLRTLRLSPYENFGGGTLSTVFVQYKPWIISTLCLVLLAFAILGLALLQTERLSRARRTILEGEILKACDRTQQALGEFIHGTVGQELTAIRVLAESLKDKAGGENERLTKPIIGILDSARRAFANVRQIAASLYPVTLPRHGFCQAVEAYLSTIAATLNIQYKTVLTENADFMGPEVSLHLYRIIQEAVHNAVRHAQAKHICVKVEEQDGSYTATIEDDGIGFDSDEINCDGLGLHIMKYRSNAIGGDLAILKRVPRGTAVVCTFNLETSDPGMKAKRRMHIGDD